MSFEQSLTRRTELCRNEHCSIVKEEMVYLTCGGDRFLTEAFTSSGCRFVYHDDFLDLLDSVKLYVASATDSDDDDLIDAKYLLKNLEKIEAETNWEKSILFYEAG